MKTAHHDFSRRKFLLNAALFGGAMFLPGCASSPKRRKLGPNDRLNVAIIGVGGIGKLSISKLKDSPFVNMAAFCDVDENRAAEGFKSFPKIPKFRDYRAMLDKMDSQIDAVVISTPDHMHYPIASWAIAKGKHVYCQKPLTRTVWESRRLRRLAKEAGVITQMGNQGHTFDGWRSIKEWCEAGILGQIEEIHSWTDRPIWPQGNIKRPPAQPIPATLDYNLWLGVAPDAPYSQDVLPFNWRGFRDYGTGAGGDMACHILDVSYSAFGLDAPKKVWGDCSEYSECAWPQQATSHIEFENPRGVDGKITLHWYDGGRKPKNVKRVEQSFIDDPRMKNGTLIVGTKETVYTNEYGINPLIFPRSRMVELKRSGALPQKSIERSKFADNPQQEWAKACLDNVQPPANFEYAAPFTEVSLLLMVPVFESGVLEYDASKMRFSNRPSADKYLSSLYEYKKEFLPS